MAETDNVEELKVKEEPKVEVEVEAEAESGSEDEISDETKELLEFKDKFYYVAAEMENLKKRHERDMQNQIKYGSEKILKGLLEVVDNLERTMMAISNDEDEKVKNIYVGVDMVKNQFIDVLKQNGLEQVETEGKIFDPNFHEAMAQQPAEGKEDQEIIQVYQQGYTLNGRLIRAAKVVVAKN